MSEIVEERRWTDGDAWVPLAGGAAVVEVTFGDTLPYRVADAVAPGTQASA